MGSPQTWNVFIQGEYVREATPEHDDVRIEHVDHARERPRHSFLMARERFLRRPLARRRLGHDLGWRQAASGPPFVIGPHAWPRNERLEASVLTAITRRTRALLVGWPWHGIVAPLP